MMNVLEPKRGEQTPQAKKESKPLPKWYWVLLAVGLAGCLWVEYFAPGAAEQRAERIRKIENQERVQQETEHLNKLYKDGDELVKGRPLNAVEEKNIRDIAERHARETVNRK